MASLKEYLINAAASAALIGAGGAVVSTKINDARQDEQIATSSRLLPEIQKDVKETHDAVIRLEAKQSNGSR